MTYIERKALPKPVELECLDRESFKPRTVRVKAYLAEDVDKLPAADVVSVKYGQWSCDDEDGFYEYDWHCSICGGTILYRVGHPVFSRYCPSCGAKMDLED